MENLLRTLIPMIQSPESPAQAQPYHEQMYNQMPIPNTQQPKPYPQMMYQGGLQSSVAPTASWFPQLRPE